MNWEGDNDIAPWVETLGGGALFLPRNDDRLRPYWDELVEYFQARAQGVRDARALQTGSPSDPNRPSIYFGLEYVLVRRIDSVNGGYRGPCSSEPLERRCIIDYVAPKVTVDYYSYSSWDTTSSPKVGVGYNLDLKYKLQEDINFALAKVNTNRTDGNTYTHKNFILGEYGYHGGFIGDSLGSLFIKELFAAVEAVGLSHAIFWQIKDNNYQRWVDDVTPSSATRGTIGGDSWHDITTNPTPIFGQTAFQTSTLSGVHGIYFENTNTQTSPALVVPYPQLKLFVYVYLDPVNPPQEIMFEWQDSTGSKEHRVYWGQDSIPLGISNTVSRRPMGQLPPPAQWVRLEIRAGDIGLGAN